MSKDERTDEEREAQDLQDKIDAIRKSQGKCPSSDVIPKAHEDDIETKFRKFGEKQKERERALSTQDEGCPEKENIEHEEPEAQPTDQLNEEESPNTPKPQRTWNIARDYNANKALLKPMGNTSTADTDNQLPHRIKFTPNQVDKFIENIYAIEAKQPRGSKDRELWGSIRRLLGIKPKGYKVVLGKFAIPRRIADNPLLEHDARAYGLFVRMVQEATFVKKRTVYVIVSREKIPVTLFEGELLGGSRGLSELTGIPSSTIIRRLAELQDAELISMSKRKGVTIITICHYSNFRAWGN